MDFAALVYPFTLGSIAAFNPCGFAMLPAFVSYFLATEDGAISSTDVGWVARATRALRVGLTLTAGFLTLFVVAGGVISAGGLLLVTSVPWLGLVIGVLFVALGLWLLTGRHVALPNLPMLHFERARTIKSVYIFGVAYGVVSLSCTLPLFFGVVSGALTQDGVVRALTQFVAYALGMGFVMMAITLSLALFEGLMITRMRQIGPYVSRLGALALVAAGGYMVYYWLDVILLMNL